MDDVKGYSATGVYHAAYDHQNTENQSQNLNHEHGIDKRLVADLAATIRASIPSARFLGNEALMAVCWEACFENKQNDRQWIEVQIQKSLPGEEEIAQAEEVAPKVDETPVEEPSVEATSQSVEATPEISVETSPEISVEANLEEIPSSETDEEIEKKKKEFSAKVTPRSSVQSQEDLEPVFTAHLEWKKSVLNPKDMQVSGRANLSKNCLQGLDFSGRDISYANFSQANCQNANFMHANLSRVNFRKADLTSADLRGADISKANFEDATLANTIFDPYTYQIGIGTVSLPAPKELSSEARVKIDATELEDSDAEVGSVSEDEAAKSTVSTT